MGGRNPVDTISIHALRKESDKDIKAVSDAIKISIHALRKESDVLVGALIGANELFQSTLSVRRATP